MGRESIFRRGSRAAREAAALETGARMNPAPTANIITRQTIIAVALVGLAVLIWSIAEVLVIAFGAVVLATVLRALAGPLHRATKWSERVSLFVVVLGLIVVFGLLFWLFGRQ